MTFNRSSSALDRADPSPGESARRDHRPERWPYELYSNERSPSATSRRIVIACRNARARKWSKRWLERAGFEVVLAENGPAVLAAVRCLNPQVVLVDPGLRLESGVSLCRELRSRNEIAELAIVTLCSGSRDVRRALKAGTTDVVRKPFDWQLISRRIALLARIYDSQREMSDLRVRLDEAERLAEEAELHRTLQSPGTASTDLPDRSRFEGLIEKALVTSRADAQLAILFLNMDRFKAINEIVGRIAGDKILRRVAVRLQGCLRKNEIVVRSGPGVGTAAVARLTGDEFALLLTHVDGRRGVLQTAQALQKELAKPFLAGDREIYLSATLGAALSSGELDTGELLLQRAELAMSEAKRHGGGMVRFFDHSMDPFNERSADLHRMLREAHESGDLTLHYQPLIDSADGRVVAAEALLRWQHEELGWMSPADFLPAAEGTDLMLSIGEWVLRTACRQVVEWRDAGLPQIRIAVNVASCQLRRSNLAALVPQVLADCGLAAGLLELELSEKGVLFHDHEILQQLKNLKKLGVRLSVDDFGTGDSALGYLKRFPLDVLKIDRSYVAGLASSESDAGVASAMVSLAHSLDLAVVAEGVEEEAQSDLLRELGCDELQGFLFSPAVREEEFRQILERGSHTIQAAAPPTTEPERQSRSEKGL